MVVDYELNTSHCNDLLDKADILFCLDFNSMHRTKKMETVLLGAKCVKVLLDHHEQPAEEHFDYGVSDIAKSSTCEMVYDFIVGSSYADKLNLDIAACLYTGMMTDTGSFRFSITSANTHKAVAHLKELGLEHSIIHENMYDNFLENRLRFMGNALLHRLEVLYEHNTALMAIPKRDLIKYEITTGDTEGLVNYLLTIEGIKLGALLIDRVEERKWSFRSKNDFDVNELARNHFEGGGHPRQQARHVRCRHHVFRRRRGKDVPREREPHRQADGDPDRRQGGHGPDRSSGHLLLRRDQRRLHPGGSYAHRGGRHRQVAQTFRSAR